MSEPSKPSGGGLVGGAALGNSSSSNSNSGMQVPPLPGSLVGGLTGVGGLRGSGGVAPGRLARTGTPVQGSISLNAGNIVGGIGGMGGMGGGGFGGGLAGGGSGMNPASASAASLGANRSSSGTSAIGGGANYVNVGSSLNGATDEFADDRSDAATIGTSIADWGETHDAPVVSAPADTFDAVKRWALRVNNSYPMSQVTGDIDELVLVDRPLAPAIPPSSSSAINSVRGLASAARPSRFRRMSSKIDPAYLNEFLSTLDESDAEAMCNFVASYHGPDVISAMHTHLAKIQDLRAAENNKEEMPLKPLEWESLPLVDEGDLDDGVVLMRREQQNRSQPAGTVAFSSSTEDGLFSDEADVWEQTEGAQSAAESDWIVLDDYSAPTRTFSKRHVDWPASLFLLSGKN
ncbi:hypothetical protein BC830DRAFT_512247 [Chytriomyces sp. MP71]|nr:hypothetical protein BC830DRAFT_512247 [Chytriomyces sp. MP71]